ncbi:ATP-binding protein [Streptomyces sp. NBC_01803]|uniref:ATP-binding protein n=1 Tax=Streptomyces sp. NBC_01803 TaxID=2975946 RepID=UPI002DDA4D80|nr:ATP-binding protein [Streptomyces sp. NBC_01803]WSA46012.1 ATP-binding protein [Streptomyces sp. NBC_01803]
MSDSLKRHLAKAALLLAAGAAPVVATAGHAGAAEQPQSTGLSGLTSLDNEGLGETLDSATTTTTNLAEEVGGDDAVKTAMPIVAPLAHQAVSETGRTTSSLAEDLTHILAERGADPENLDALVPNLADQKLNEFSLL